MSARREGAVVRGVTTAGLGLAVAGAVVVATFASEETVARLAICETPARASLAPYAYVGASLALALLYWAASAAARRGAPRRGLATVLIVVSVVGIVFSGWIASLAVGFWSAAGQPSTPEIVRVGILFVIAFVGPAIASLVAAILVGVAGSRAIPVLLPPIAVLVVTAASAGVLVLSLVVSCT